MLNSCNSEYTNEICTALGKSQVANYNVYNIWQKSQMFSNNSTLHSSGYNTYQKV